MALARTTTLNATRARASTARARAGRRAGTMVRASGTPRERSGRSDVRDALARGAIALVTSGMLLGGVVAPARAEVAPEFVDETREIIEMTRAILRGEKTDDAYLDSFQDKRRAWFAKYQYHHGKSFYGYANTWNAQAKVGVQIAVNRENGVPYDADHTVYNKPYLLSILDKGEAELLDMQSRNGF